MWSVCILAIYRALLSAYIVNDILSLHPNSGAPNAGDINRHVG